MLMRCLEKLQDAHEIIVADDSVDTATKKLLEARFPTVRWIAGPRRGPAANRNAGARAATGEWIAFIDDDCEPEPGWVVALAAHTGAEVIEGKTICPSERDDPFEDHVENLTGGNFWSCNLALRKAAFTELGGFDEDFLDAAGEDMELAWRIRQRGLRTVFAPDAQVIHPARRISWRKLLWRTCLLRWRLLYRLKTGQSTPLGASPWELQVILSLRNHRSSANAAQLFTQRDRKRPRTQLFHTVRRLVTFPLVLPYLLRWEFRFRRQLARRGARQTRLLMDWLGHLLRATGHFRGRGRLTRYWLNRRQPNDCRTAKLPGGAEIICEMNVPYEAMVWLGQEEPEDLRMLQRLLQPGQTFVDCGANIGLWSLVAATAVQPNGKVFAFEPNPRTHQRLTQHIEQNRFAATVATFSSCCGARSA